MYWKLLQGILITGSVYSSNRPQGIPVFIRGAGTQIDFQKVPAGVIFPCIVSVKTNLLVHSVHGQIKVTITMGVDMGTMMRKKIIQKPAPSMRAALSKSLGTAA
jgi:hypothetical protein